MRKTILATLVAFSLIGAASIQAADYSLKANDISPGSSWTNSTNWTSGAVPAAGNNYYTGPYALRTPSDVTNSATFAGASLIVNSNGLINIKSMGNLTATLVLSNGTLHLGGSANTGVGGYITNLGPTTLAAGTTNALSTDTSTRVMNMVGVISGSGQFMINNIRGDNSTVGVRLSGANTYTGITIITNSSLVFLNHPLGLGTLAGATYVASGSTLNINGQQPVGEPLFVSGTGINGAGVLINTGTALVNQGYTNTVTLQGNTTFGGSTRFDIMGANGGKLVAGGYNLTKIGGNEIVLNNQTNTGLGAIDVQAGQLTILGSSYGSPTTGAFGDPTKTLNVASGTTLSFYNVNNTAGTPLNKVVTLQGGANFNNNQGNSYFSGPITAGVNANIGGVGTQFHLYGPLSLAGNANIGTGNTAVSLYGAVTGTAGAITKNGTGLLYLEAATYNGPTLVNGGRLVLGPNCNLENSPAITLAAGTALDVSAQSAGYTVPANQILNGFGAVTGKVSVVGTLAPGYDGAIGTLTFTNDLALANQSVFRVDLSDLTNVYTNGLNDVVLANNLSLDGLITVIPAFGPNGPLLGTPYTLIKYSGTLSGTPSFVVAGGYTGTVDTSTPGEVRLTISGGSPSVLTWKGDGILNWWDLGNTPNFLKAGLPSKFNSGDAVIFDGTGSTNPAVNITVPVGPASMLVNTPASNYVYTMTGASGIGGAAKLTKDGPGLLVLGTPNSYVGGTDVKAGVLRINNAAALGAAGSAVTVRNGAQVDLNGVNHDNAGRTFYYYVSGEGPDGRGAVINNPGTAIDQTKSGLRYITLTGDTTFGGGAAGSRYDLGFNNGWINGNNFALIKKGPHQVNVRGPVTGVREFIVLEGQLYGEMPDAFNSVARVFPGASLGAWAPTGGITNSAAIYLHGGIFGAQSASTANDAVVWTGPIYVVAPSFLNPGIGGGNAILRLEGSLNGIADLRHVQGSTANRMVLVTRNNDATFTGRYLMDGGALLRLGGGNGSVGTGTIVNYGTVEFLRTNASTFAQNIEGAGTVTHQNGAAALTLSGNNVMVNLRVQSGNDSNPLILASGSRTIAQYVGLAIDNDKGLLQIEPGAFLQTGNLFVGEQASRSGSVVQNGGEVVLFGQLRVGHYPTETSTYTMNDGTLTMMTIAASVGEVNGMVVLGVDGTGILLQKGGVIAASGLTLDNRTGDTPGTDTYALEGGTLRLGLRGLTSGNNGANANNTVAFLLGGGTLSASDNWTAGRPMTLTGTNGSLRIDPQGYAITLAGALTGPGGLIINGAGVVNLNGVSSYAGDTIVSGGILAVGGTLGTNVAGNLTVSGGILGGTGMVQQTVMVSEGGAVAGGLPGTTGKLTLANITVNDGARILLDLGATAAGTNDLIAATNALTASGRITVDFNFLAGAPELDVPYTIATGLVVNAGGVELVSSSRYPATFALTNYPAGGQGVTVTFTAGTPGQNLSWVGFGVYTNWVAGGDASWLNIGSSLFDSFSLGDTVTFDDGGDNGAPINLMGLLTVSNVFVTGTKDWVFGGSGRLAGPGGLTKTGTGKLTLLGAHQYTNRTILNGGTLEIVNDASLGIAPAARVAGFLTLNGTLRIQNETVINPNRGLMLGVAGGTGGGIIDVPAGKQVTYAGYFNDAGISGSLTKTGGGMLTLGGNLSVYSGGTFVNEGVLNIAVGGDGAAATYKSALSPSRPVTINAGGTLRYAAGDAVGWNLANPSMTYIIGGTNTIAAGIHCSVGYYTLDGGTITSEGLGNSAANNQNYVFDRRITVLPNANPSVISPYRINLRGGANPPAPEPVVFDVADGTASPDLLVKAEFIGTQVLAKEGPGTMLLDYLNTYTGATEVRAGTLALGPLGTITGTPTITLLSNTVLDVSSKSGGWAMSGSQTLNISNATVKGSVVVNGGQTIALGQNNIAVNANITSNLVFFANAKLDLSLGANPAGVPGVVNDLLTVGGDLSLQGRMLVTIYPNDVQYGVGTYRLINYAGNLVGSPDYLVVSNSVGASRYTFTIDTSTPHQVNLVVSGGSTNLLWSGANGANWDTSTPNWLLAGVAPLQLFFHYDNVVLDESSSINGLALGIPVYPGSVTVNGSKNYNISGAGRISGTAGLVKNGSGILTLSTPNDFRGDVVVTDGTLRIGNASALGNAANIYVTNRGQVDINGVTQSGKNYTFYLQGTGPDGQGALINSGAAASVASIRNLVLRGDATMRFFNRVDIGDALGGRFGSIIGNGFKLTKEGPAPVPFHASASNLGELIINDGLIYGESWDYSLGSGLITVNPLGRLGAYRDRTNNPSIVLNGGILEGSGGSGQYLNAWLGPVTVNANSTINSDGANGTATVGLFGPVSGAGNITKLSARNLLLAGTNTHTGELIINGGVVSMGPNATLASKAVRVGSGTTFAVRNLAPFGVARQGSYYDVTVFPSRAIDGVLDGIFGNGSVTHTLDNGAQWWEVDLLNSQRIDRVHVWFRTDCCQVRNDNLRIVIYDIVGAATNVVWSYNLPTTPGATSNYPVDVPGVVGRVVRIERITGAASPAGADKIISLAEVQVFQNTALPLNGQTLAGSGTVLGSVNVQANAIVQPGAEQVAGTLTINGSLDLGSGSTLLLDLNSTNTEGAGVNDLLVISSNFTITGSAVLKVNPFNGAFLPDTNYNIIRYSGTLSGLANLVVTSDVRNAVVTLDTSVPNLISVRIAGAAPLSLDYDGSEASFLPPYLGNWDLLETSTHWNTGSQSFRNGDNVLFGSGAFAFLAMAGSTSEVNTAGLLMPGTIQFANEAAEGNYLLTGPGSIGGLSLTKSGEGRVILANSGLNFWSGPTIINGGILQLGNDGTAGSLSATPVQLNGGVLELRRSDNLVFPNVLTGGAVLRKYNPNIVTVTGNSPAFLGTFEVMDGTLKAGNAGGFGAVTNALGQPAGVIINPGATFDVNGLSVGYEPINIAGTGVGGNGAVINTGAEQQNALRSLNLTADASVGVIFGRRYDLRSAGATTNASLGSSGQPFSLTKVGPGIFALVDASVDPALQDINVMAGNLQIASVTAALYPTVISNSFGNPAGTLRIGPGAVVDLFNIMNKLDKNVLLQSGSTLQGINGNSRVIGPVTVEGIAQIGGSATLAIESLVTGPGQLAKIGGGALRIGWSNTLGTLSVPVDVKEGVLEFLHSDDYTVTSPIRGASVMRQGNGSGKVIISGTNLFITTVRAESGDFTKPIEFAPDSLSDIPGTLQVATANNNGAVVIQPGARVNAANFQIGENSGQTGRVTQVGGDVLVRNQFRLGHFANNVSTYYMQGGTLTLTNIPAGTVHGGTEQNGVLYVGIDGIGQFVQSGGSVSANALVLDHRGSTVFNTVNSTLALEGGRLTLSTNGLRAGGTDANTSYRIFIGGGTLAASADWNSPLAMTLTGTNGSPTIDSSGYTITLSGALIGSAGLNKVGAGSLVAGNAANSLAGSVDLAEGSMSLGGAVGGPLLARPGTRFLPGGALVGVVTVSNNVTFAGATLVMDLHRSLAQNCDSIRIVTPSLLGVGGGTLIITNAGPALFAGDTFKLFDLQNGASFDGPWFASIELPPLPPGSSWDTNQLSTAGIIKVVTPPVFALQPQNTLRNVGTNAIFTAGVSPSGGTYQWYFNGITPVGVSSSTLTLNNIQTTNAGDYFVVVATAFGNATSRVGTLVVNQFPVGGIDTYSVSSNQPSSISLMKLLLNDSDPDGDPVTLASVSATSTNGGTVSLVTDRVVYTPVNGFVGADKFTYTINDGRGAATVVDVQLSVSADVSLGLNQLGLPVLTNGVVNIRFAGIPGRNYALRRTQDFVSWTSISTNAAPVWGIIEFVDPAPPVGTVIYRTRQEP